MTDSSTGMLKPQGRGFLFINRCIYYWSKRATWSQRIVLPFPSPRHESESEVAQSCPTLRNPMDCSLPGSSIHGIFQARVLEWSAIATSFKRSHAHTISDPNPAAGHRRPTPPPHSLGHSRASLAQSLVGTLLLVCTRFSLCPPRVCFPSPVEVL